MTPFRPYRFPPLPPQPQGDGAPSADGGYRQDHAACLEDGRAQGYAQGHAEGVVQGRIEGLQRGAIEARALARDAFAQLARPLDAMLAAVTQLLADLRAAQRGEVVDLVGKVARRVIRAELALQPQQLLALVEEALVAMPPARDGVDVFLHPDELRRIAELDPAGAARWMLLPDPGLAPGECRVRAGGHEVDAGCEGRLAAVMEHVEQQLLIDEAQP